MQINFNGKNFVVDPTYYKDFWENFSKWEQIDLNFFIKKAEEDKIFIDIGAWIGPYTLLAAKMGMKVYAFEPDEMAFKQLKRNIELNNFKHQPEVYNFGLSKKETSAYLYSNTNEFGKSESGLINYKNKENTKKSIIEIKSFIKEMNKIKKNSFNFELKILKIDIEGGEFLFENEIYQFVKSEKLYCILSYHFMVHNNNKLRKNFLKIRTLFYQIMIKKIFPSKNKFKIANIFKG